LDLHHPGRKVWDEVCLIGPVEADAVEEVREPGVIAHGIKERV
jgi:hypothetical protein